MIAPTDRPTSNNFDQESACHLYLHWNLTQSRLVPSASLYLQRFSRYDQKRVRQLCASFAGDTWENPDDGESCGRRFHNCASWSPNSAYERHQRLQGRHSRSRSRHSTRRFGRHSVQLQPDPRDNRNKPGAAEQHLWRPDQVTIHSMTQSMSFVVRRVTHLMSESTSSPF